MDAYLDDSTLWIPPLATLIDEFGLPRPQVYTRFRDVARAFTARRKAVNLTRHCDEYARASYRLDLALLEDPLALESDATVPAICSDGLVRASIGQSVLNELKYDRVRAAGNRRNGLARLARDQLAGQKPP